MAEEDKSFVSRWSRMKRARETEVLPDPAMAAGAPIAKETGEPESVDEIDTQKIVEALPDIESMTEKSDFTVFLQKGVPQELKQRALRRLWRLNPIFANLDGLNDYDDDFTDAALVVKNLKTLYEVGKGMPDPKKPDPEEEEAAETASDSGEEKAPQAENQEPVEQEPKGEVEDAETSAIAESEHTGTLASDSRGRVAEPMPSASPHRGRAAQRRWGSVEG